MAYSVATLSVVKPGNTVVIETRDRDSPPYEHMQDPGPSGPSGNGMYAK